MRTPAFILLIIVLVILGCSADKNIELLDLDTQFQKIAVQIRSDTSHISKFPLCEIASETKWDKVGIVSPYIMAKQLKAAGIKNYGDVFSEIEYIHDSKYSVLFLKGDSIVAYGMANRGIIDLSAMVLLKSVIFINFKDCEKLQLRKNGTELEWLFANNPTRRYINH